MKCYRTNCKEKCDKYKMMGCVFKLTEEQQEFVANMQGYCEKCGTKLIKARYKGEGINLCTSCGVRGNVA